MDYLLKRSGGRCEICRVAGVDSSHRMLYIDHDDGGGYWAVRGLLCGTCNTKLEHENRFSPEADRYLQNAWFKQRAAELGVDEYGDDEPTDGRRFVDCHGRYWFKPEGQELWRAGGGAPGRVRDKSWEQLVWMFGPINLRPVLPASAGEA